MTSPSTPAGHHTEDAMNETFVGNPPDLSQAGLATAVTEIKEMLGSHSKQLHSLDKEVASHTKQLDMLYQQLDKHRKELAEQHEEIDELGEQMRRLNCCAPGYNQARNQSIRTYKHDMLKDHSNLDHNILEEEDIMRVGGDVLVDATLCTSPEVWGWPREYIDTFNVLYGVEPRLALKIKHHMTIDALNAHADTLVRMENNVSQKFRQAFEKLIELLKGLDGDEGDPDGLADACQEFLDCNEREVMETA